jgi:hypothetical protein
MPQLVTAEGVVLDQILDDTYPIWNEGLSREAYGRWNALQARTPWGKKHLRRVALVESAGSRRMLASAKWYDLAATLDGASHRMLGVGAVFTPAAERGKGHAKVLIERMMSEAAAEGYGSALLFSEIGAAYYEGLGFRAIPRETLTLDVAHKPGAPAVLVRAGEESDLALLSELDHAHAAAARLSLERPPEKIQFAVAKRRAMAALAPLGQRQVDFYVTEEGTRAVAYVLISRGPSGNLADGPSTMWLEACGDRDPTGARVGAMLQVLFARTPAEPPPPLHAWLPDGWLPPQCRITSREPAQDVLMVKALGSTELPELKGKDIFWWHGDYF